MRLLELKAIQTGMTVAQPIYGLNGEVLIRQDGVLTDRVIEKLQHLGWNYLYVDDDYSKDVAAKCSISPKVRNQAIIHMKQLYLLVQKNKTVTKETVEAMANCLSSVKALLDDVIAESISLVDTFDIKMMKHYKYAHSVNVCIISLVIGKAMGLNQSQLYDLGVGAFFHDLGQMFIDDAIIDKEGIYSDEEYAMMKKHPDLGYRFAKDYFELPVKSYLAILQHHERYDGTGYPLGKAGEGINLYGRIVAVADVFDALTTDKPYRSGMTPVAAFKHVVVNSKKAFDPKIVKVFFEKVSPYPVGFTLHLPDGRDVIVIENIEGKPLAPKVKVIKEHGEALTAPYMTVLEA